MSTVDEEVGVPFTERHGHPGAERPDVVAVTMVDEQGSRHALTWSQLDRRSNQVARAMLSRGVGLGDRVGLELPNSMAMVEAVLATWKVGASPVPVRWDLPEWERDRVADVLAAALMVGRSGDDLFAEADDCPPTPFRLVVSPSVVASAAAARPVRPKSSWTIRRPYSCLRRPIRSPPPGGWRWVPNGSSSPRRMYHTNGFAQFTYLLAGDTLTIMSKFDAALAVDLIEQQRITAFTATPTMLARIARLPESTSATSRAWCGFNRVRHRSRPTWCAAGSTCWGANGSTCVTG